MSEIRSLADTGKGTVAKQPFAAATKETGLADTGKGTVAKRDLEGVIE